MYHNNRSDSDGHEYNSSMNTIREFHLFCQNGDMEAVTRYIMHYREIISEYNSLNQAFVIACRYGQLDIVHYLYDIFAPIITCWYESYKAFRLACREGHLGVAMWLKSTYEQIDALANQQYAVIWAARNGHYVVVECIFNMYPEILQTDYSQVLLQLARKNNLSLFQNLFSRSSYPVNLTGIECYVKKFIKHGNIRAVTWLIAEKHSRGYKYIVDHDGDDESEFMENLLENAMKTCDISVANYVINHVYRKINKSDMATITAIRKGFLPGLRLIHHYFGADYESEFKIAHQYAQIPIIEYLRQFIDCQKIDAKNLVNLVLSSISLKSPILNYLMQKYPGVELDLQRIFDVHCCTRKFDFAIELVEIASLNDIKINISDQQIYKICISDVGTEIVDWFLISGGFVNNNVVISTCFNAICQTGINPLLATYFLDNYFNYLNPVDVLNFLPSFYRTCYCCEYSLTPIIHNECRRRVKQIIDVAQRFEACRHPRVLPYIIYMAAWSNYQSVLFSNEDILKSEFMDFQMAFDCAIRHSDGIISDILLKYSPDRNIRLSKHSMKKILVNFYNDPESKTVCVFINISNQSRLIEFIEKVCEHCTKYNLGNGLLVSLVRNIGIKQVQMSKQYQIQVDDAINTVYRRFHNTKRARAY